MCWSCFIYFTRCPRFYAFLSLLHFVCIDILIFIIYSDQDDDLVYISEKKPSKEEARKIQRAKSYQELNERLNKLKGTKDFSIKTKLMKKSLARKIKKQNKKNERRTKNKTIRIERTKPNEDAPEIKEEKIKLPKVATKPVFNSQGKMVFSKFDFSESGIPEGKLIKLISMHKINYFIFMKITLVLSVNIFACLDKRKGEKNPKKILETLKKHKETLKELNVAGEKEKAAHLMEKTAWKNALAKAEGQKIKDDPILLKKSASKLVSI